MTDQTPEIPEWTTATQEADETPVEVEIVAAELEPDLPTNDAELEVETETIEAEVVDLDLGDELTEAPVGTDFDVIESPHISQATPASEFEIGVAGPAIDQPGAAPTPPSAGGSFLDLPPLPDLSYSAPTSPPASPYPPPAPAYPQASNYPQPTNPPPAGYAPYPMDYSEQAAGQAYGHGTPAPQPGQLAPASPYGSPTGFAVAPHRPGAPAADLTMASVAHWGALVANVLTGTGLGFLVPLILMQTTGKTDLFVRANAVESLNFSLTMLLGMVVSLLLLLVFVGIAGLIVIPIVTIILQILGALAANRGEVYRYPLSIRFVK